MGVDEHDAQNAVRLSFGRGTSAADVEHIVERLVRGAARLRETAT
jgi:cysteine sulfinate desulfinase/cysteine desulfurase-like protein